MHELINYQSANKYLFFLAVFSPFFGLMVGGVFGAHDKKIWPKMLSGFIMGMLGTVSYGLWKLYNVITDYFGVDSLFNMILQIVLFALLGMFAGYVVFMTAYKIKTTYSDSEDDN
ncbi:MAG: hypothetical protein SNJ70_02890 [Armatimonadota bacterium]